MTDKELLDCLTDRPCAVCKFHEEKGCTKWDCVFDQREPKTEPCEDCIRRELVLRELDKYLCGVPFDEKGIDEVIKDLPPVTPQPKTGHWIWCIGSHKCSNCEEYTCFSHKELLRYCPNCGARMSEVSE